MPPCDRFSDLCVTLLVFSFLGEEIDRINPSLWAAVRIIFDFIQKLKVQMSASPSASEYLLNDCLIFIQCFHSGV